MATELNSGTFGKKYFDISESTWHFFGLSLATGGIYGWYIVFNIFSVLKKKYAEANNLWIMLLVAIGLLQWLSIFSELFLLGGGALAVIFFIAHVVLLVIIAIKSADLLERMFAENNLNVKMNRFFVFIIFGIYHYYKIRNAEEEHMKNTMLTQQVEAASKVANQQYQDDKIAQLEKLAKLKNSGAITQEEFDAEKAKLLAQ